MSNVAAKQADFKGPKLAPFNPSGEVVIATALRLLAVGPADILFDLGCGDARLLIAAAGYAETDRGDKESQNGDATQVAVARAIGVEYDGAVYARAVARIANVAAVEEASAAPRACEGASSCESRTEPQSLLVDPATGAPRSSTTRYGRVEVRHGNALATDIGEATAVFVYLVPEGMKAIKPKLQAAMAHGARVVTYIFSLPGLTPAAVELYKGTKIYLYTDPTCDGVAWAGGGDGAAAGGARGGFLRFLEGFVTTERYQCK